MVGRYAHMKKKPRASRKNPKKIVLTYVKISIDRDDEL